MGIIRAGLAAAGGTLGDQWLEAIEPDNMTSTTIMTTGVLVNKNDSRNRNRKGTGNVITDGSIIHVGENQIMILVDGGKIIDYSAEPGYYKVDNQNAPSMFSGDFGGALSDAFNRLKFGGTTPYTQQVYYINTQEIKDIPFGTANAINYFDNFYNAELYLRAHGYYSVRIVNPLKFYAEVVDRSASRMEVSDLQGIFLSEFLTAFQSAIGQMSVEGDRISHVSSKSSQLAAQMADILDADWEERRGMKIESVGISSISYDDASKELINIRNQGAMLGDPNVRTGYVQGAAARGVEAAGSNPGGATGGFFGMNMAMNTTGNLVDSANQANQQAVVAQQQSQPQGQAPAAPVVDSWACAQCGQQNSGGKFCQNCGTPRPTAVVCSNCQTPNPPGAKFCQNCGTNLG